MPKHDTFINLRLPSDLAADLRAVAERDHNGLSSTLRRLLSAAIARERSMVTADGR